MKVRKLIELLQKQNPESEIFLEVDGDLDFGGEYGWALAERIKVLGHDVRYEDPDEGTIRTREKLEEYIAEDYADEPTQEEIDDRIANHKKLSGVWIRIEP